MLESLRNATGGWVAKIFIALLVASFAVFGIADIFTGGQGNSLATVGKTEISSFEYQRVFRAEVRALSQRLGRTINPQQARTLGLDRQVLSQLIGQAALDNHVEYLGLKVSDKTIAESIANNPAFKDGRGDFNRAQFQSILFQNGLTEQTYVASERSALLRGQIGRIIETGIAPPEFLLKTLFKYQSEKRQASYFKVPASAAGSIAEPSEAEISGYYNKNKSEFKSPEYRKLTILSVQPADIADTIEVTDEELKQAYTERLDQFERLARTIGIVIASVNPARNNRSRPAAKIRYVSLPTSTVTRASNQRRNSRNSGNPLSAGRPVQLPTAVNRNPATTARL